MDCSPPHSSDRGVSQARILEWVAIPSPRGLPDSDWTPLFCTGRWISDHWAARWAQLFLVSLTWSQPSYLASEILGMTELQSACAYYCMDMAQNSSEKTLMLVGLKVGGEGDDRGWGGWMASATQWIWVWVNSGSWWWTGRPGVLWSMGSQRVRHSWVTELNWTGSKQ